MAMTREATFRTICPFSKKIIYPGNRITKYTTAQHQAFVSSCNKNCPDDVVNYILFMSGQNDKIGLWGLDSHANWMSKKSLSGRTIKPVLKQEDRTFVAGSGFSGCDHYDLGYDRGVGAGETPVNNHENLRDFVVDDTIVEYDQSLQPDEEFRNCDEEWNDAETSDEEDDWSCDSDEE